MIKITFAYKKNCNLTGQLYLDNSSSNPSDGNYLLEAEDIAINEEQIAGQGIGLYSLYFPTTCEAGNYILVIEEYSDVVVADEISWDGTNARSSMGWIRAKLHNRAELNLTNGILTYYDEKGEIIDIKYCYDKDNSLITDVKQVIVKMLDAPL